MIVNLDSEPCKPVITVEPFPLLCFGEFDEGLGHFVEAEGVELVEGGMLEQVGFSFNGIPRLIDKPKKMGCQGVRYGFVFEA